MQIIFGQRNKTPLDKHQIKACKDAWHLLGGRQKGIRIDFSKVYKKSNTVYNSTEKKVYIGTDVYPLLSATSASLPHSRLSLLACLAHELAHAERDKLKIVRPYDDEIGYLIEEAEACLHASFYPVLSAIDRYDLYECAQHIISKVCQQCTSPQRD